MNVDNENTPFYTRYLDNTELEKSIQTLNINQTANNLDNFIGCLLPASVIVLISEFIHESVDDIDEDGFFSISKLDNIPVVKFEDETGTNVLPIFTNAHFAESLPYFEGYIPLIIPSIHALEMAATLDCDKISINFESNLMIDLNKTLVESLIFKLITQGDLSIQNSFI